MDNLPAATGFVTPPAARIIPFAAFIAFVMLQSAAGDGLAALGLDARWYYVMRAVAVGFLVLLLWRHYGELHTAAGVTGVRVLLAVGAGLLVFALWINLDFEWARIGRPVAFDPSQPEGGGLDHGFVFFRLLGLAVVVPVVEELFWRSFLLRRIDQQDFLAQQPGRASLRAILICAVLFASEHTLWLAGLLAGLVYAFVYVYSGNLWLPIISHATTNAVLGGWILATGHWEFW